MTAGANSRTTNIFPSGPKKHLRASAAIIFPSPFNTVSTRPSCPKDLSSSPFWDLDSKKEIKTATNKSNFFIMLAIAVDLINYSIDADIELFSNVFGKELVLNKKMISIRLMLLYLPFGNFQHIFFAIHPDRREGKWIRGLVDNHSIFIEYIIPESIVV